MDEIFYGRLPLWAVNHYWVRYGYAVFYNQEWEKEAQEIMRAPFIKTARLCFALTELYRFGTSPTFSEVSVAVNFVKAVYWHMQGLARGSEQESAKRTDFSDEAYLFPDEGYQAYFNTEILTKEYIKVLDGFLKREWERLKGHTQENQICEYARHLRIVSAEKADLGYDPDLQLLYDCGDNVRYEGFC